MTVGQISGRLGLQHCSLMTVGSMTRDSRALHASGNIHLDDWEMCSGPLDIWHISLSHVSTWNHSFCIRWSFPKHFLEGGKSLNCLRINLQVIRHLEGTQGSSCARLEGRAPSRLGMARKGTGIFLLKPQKTQDTSTIQFDHLSFLFLFGCSPVSFDLLRFFSLSSVNRN